MGLSSKSGDIDLLFVYNMLLTGFDAKRLKKLYLGRVVRDHNLLQTLTRVNRPYKNFRYGYVVDFADIRSAFNKANKEYFDELQEELGDELQTYSNLFKTKEEIELEIQEIQDKLFSYNLENAEEFSRQISAIEDRKLALEIKKSLESLRNLHNIIKIQGDHEFLEKIDFQKINILYNEASRHLDLLNLKENMESGTGSTHLLDSALENVLFRFRKISEEELIIADKLKDILRKTRETLKENFDQTDPQWISLFEELKNLFQKKNLNEITQDDMKQNIGTLEHIYSRILELNRKNDLIRAKYKSDKKYARIHKRLWERGNISSKESIIHNVLTKVKEFLDERILLSGEILENEGYFGKMIMPIIIESFEGFKIQLDIEAAHFVKGLIAKEYITEYRGVA